MWNNSIFRSPSTHGCQMFGVACALFGIANCGIFGFAGAQEPKPSAAAPTKANSEAVASPPSSKPAERLPMKSIDLPAKYKLDSRNGLTIKIHEGEAGTDVLFLFFGERHFSGALKLKRILFHFPRGKEVLSLSDCKQVLYEDGQTLDCLSGYLVLDRKKNKIEIDFVVFDDGDWNRFGWNQICDYEIDPDLALDKIKENMGHKVSP